MGGREAGRLCNISVIVYIVFLGLFCYTRMHFLLMLRSIWKHYHLFELGWQSRKGTSWQCIS